jgi:hypothetical protein
MMVEIPNEVTFTTKDGRKVTVTRAEFEASMIEIFDRFEAIREKMKTRKQKPA